MALTPLGAVALPPFRASAFDHGDVHLASGRIFVAHTAAGSVEVIDAERRVHERTVPGCPDASGILCAQEMGVTFAAARGAGRVPVVDAASLAVVRELASGPKPNGLAWDERRRRLLAADVQDLSARLLDPSNGELVAQMELPGRPRWCVYDREADRFPCISSGGFPRSRTREPVHQRLTLTVISCHDPHADHHQRLLRRAIGGRRGRPLEAGRPGGILARHRIRRRGGL